LNKVKKQKRDENSEGYEEELTYQEIPKDRNELSQEDAEIMSASEESDIKPSYLFMPMQF
jgi:hypothetical protein